MYEIYEALLNNIDFDANARNWMDANLPNPFKEGTPERQYYFKARQLCRDWRKGGINFRSAKQYMLVYVHRIIDLRIPNPYKPVEEETVPEEPKEQPITVLGVIPDKKKNRLSFKKKEGVKNDSQGID